MIDKEKNYIEISPYDLDKHGTDNYRKGLNVNEPHPYDLQAFGGITKPEEYLHAGGQWPPSTPMTPKQPQGGGVV